MKEKLLILIPLLIVGVLSSAQNKLPNLDSLGHLQFDERLEMIGRDYYSDFVRSQGGLFGTHMFLFLTDTNLIQPSPSQYEHCADSALKYFKQAYRLKPDQYDYLYFPIVQLETHLQTSHDPTIGQHWGMTTKDSEGKKLKLFFPREAFQFDEYWHNPPAHDEYTLHSKQSSKAKIWSTTLRRMRQKKLYGQHLEEGESMWRIIGCSPWGNSWVYLVENRNGKISVEYDLYQRKYDLRQTFERIRHIKSSKTRLNEEQSKQMQQLVEASHPWEKKSSEFYCGPIDGPVYLIEYISSSQYNVFDNCLDDATKELYNYVKQLASTE